VDFTDKYHSIFKIAQRSINAIHNIVTSKKNIEIKGLELRKNHQNSSTCSKIPNEKDSDRNLNFLIVAHWRRGDQLSSTLRCKVSCTCV
jgi:hypothetical protein